ncbi:MAG: hypothetical protein ACK55I_47080, partial [bacterium]
MRYTPGLARQLSIHRPDARLTLRSGRQLQRPQSAHDRLGQFVDALARRDTGRSQETTGGLRQRVLHRHQARKIIVRGRRRFRLRHQEGARVARIQIH